MELNIYGIAFILSFILLVALVIIGQKQNINYYLLVFSAVMVSCLGHYTVSIAEQLEVAIVGHRLIYFGGVFIPILMLFATMKLCHIEIPKWFGLFMMTFGVIVFYFAFTVGERTEYYTNLSLGHEGGMSYLIKEYGPMHSSYMILLFGCVLCTLAVIIYSMLKKKNASYRTTIYLLIMELTVVLCYLLRRITGSHIEYFVIAYIVDEILVLILLRRIGMYDVSDIVANSLDEYATRGYLIFDKHKRYVSCNDKVKEYFPKISEQKVDMPLSEAALPLLYEKFDSWLEYPEQGSYECLINKDDRVLKCIFKKLLNGKAKKQIGYMIEVVDDTQQQKYMELLNHYNADLEQEVQDKTTHISELQDNMILGMADMIENRDTNTGGHVKRTSEVIRIFTDELHEVKDEYGFTADFLSYVVKAAPMHDLGKIAVDDSILRKPGKFTKEEYEEMKKHSEKGAEIVRQIMQSVEDEKFIEIAENVAHYHHEKWDGSGYPSGISGIGIPLEARIMALADVFDALVSKRCYKEKMNYDTAFQIIEESLGNHFDPELGALFLRCRPQLEEFYNNQVDE